MQKTVRDAGSVPGSEGSPVRGHGNQLQYSYFIYLFLENPMDREAWLATVHRVTKSQTSLSDLACMNAAFN